MEQVRSFLQRMSGMIKRMTAVLRMSPKASLRLAVIKKADDGSPQDEPEVAEKTEK